MTISFTDQSVLVNGIRLSYRRWQSTVERAAPPFLLIHGLASALHIWNFVAPELSQRTGATVIALDQRGHGRSDKPESGYDNAQIVADDYALAEALGLDKPILVGHSWGAIIALNYAATHPDATRGVVMVDGGLTNMRERMAWEEAETRLAPPDFAGTPRDQFLGYYRRGELGPLWTRELEESVLNIVHLRDDDTVGPRLARANHMKILRALWESDPITLAGRVRCPVLMISAERGSGADDYSHLKRQGAARILAALTHAPDSEFVVMRDSIHDVPLQRPAALAEIIVNFTKTAGIL